MKEVKVELPLSLVESEKERILHEMEQRDMYSADSFDSALERAGKTKEEFLTEATPQAESRVILMLCLRKIAELEELVADEEQVANQMMHILTQYPEEQLKQIDQSRLRKAVEDEILDKMALDFLGTLAK